MTIREYLEESILLLTASPVVELFHVVTRKETETDGYLRVRSVLMEGEGLLEISTYCQLTGDSVSLVDYRFHWQDKAGKLRRRWDNARHHSELKTFPYHLHIGTDESVKESAIVDLSEVLRILEVEIAKG